MGRRKQEQSFTDIVLPGFEQPVPEPTRPVSKREQDEAQHKISYKRYKVAGRVHCDPCVSVYREGASKTINDASYIRTGGGEVRYLCFFHKTEAVHRDQLAGNGK